MQVMKRATRTRGVSADSRARRRRRSGCSRRSSATDAANKRTGPRQRCPSSRRGCEALEGFGEQAQQVPVQAIRKADRVVDEAMNDPRATPNRRQAGQHHSATLSTEIDRPRTRASRSRPTTAEGRSAAIFDLARSKIDRHLPSTHPGAFPRHASGTQPARPQSHPPDSIVARSNEIGLRSKLV